MPTANDTEALDTALHLAEESADSAAVLTMPRSFDETMHPFDPLLDTARLQALIPADTCNIAVDTMATAAEPPAWQEGLEPAIRASQPGNRTGFLVVIAIIFVLMAYNFRHLKRLFKTYVEELVKIRRGRDNVFDERPAADTPILILLLLQFVICGGILLTAGIRINTGHIYEPMPVPLAAKVIGIVGIYYIFQLVAYQTVGYTFTTNEGRREWIRGFNSSQALLGLLLAIPAIITIFYPSTMQWTILIGLFVYLLARILFILKGFRIFYDKISGLLYFILYLCTLEIIPLIWVYICSVYEFV